MRARRRGARARDSLRREARDTSDQPCANRSFQRRAPGTVRRSVCVQGFRPPAPMDVAVHAAPPAPTVRFAFARGIVRLTRCATARPTALPSSTSSNEPDLRPARFGGRRPRLLPRAPPVRRCPLPRPGALSADGGASRAFRDLATWPPRSTSRCSSPTRSIARRLASRPRRPRRQ